MRIFNYIIERVVPGEEIKRNILDKAELNARAGLVSAKLELRHHSLLLAQANEFNRTESEIKGYTEAIERDKKSINNWENQLTAINYERNT